MTTIHPYIHFNGNALEAFTFYKSIFGGEFTNVTHMKDMQGPGYEALEADAEKIMHIALPIGHNLLMANDVPSFMGTVSEQENRSKISVQCDSKEEADRIFNSLAVGGTPEFPMGDSPWGSYFGMLRDKYGIEWMIDFDPKLQHEHGVS
jgi:PhnB protein